MRGKAARYLEAALRACAGGGETVTQDAVPVPRHQLTAAAGAGGNGAGRVMDIAGVGEV